MSLPTDPTTILAEKITKLSMEHYDRGAIDMISALRQGIAHNRSKPASWDAFAALLDEAQEALTSAAAPKEPA